MRNIYVKIMSVILLTTILFRFVFIVHYIHHDCEDERCIICDLINKVKEDYNGFNPSIIELIIVFIFLKIIEFIKSTIINKTKNTLVGLKVELLN